MYKLVYFNNQIDNTKTLRSIKRDDGWFIPIDEDNTDYQAYLEYVKNGGTVEEWSPDGDAS